MEQQINNIHEINESVKEEFLEAFITGNLKKIDRLILESNVNINIYDKNGTTTFMWACRNGHLDIVKKLINIKELDINRRDSNGFTAFMWACLKNRKNVVVELLKLKYLDIDTYNNDNYTSFMLACANGNIDIIDLIINSKRNININSIDKNGCSALLLASINNQIDIVKRLIRIDNINVNLQNNDGYSALMLACINNNVEIVKELLKIDNVDMNLCNNNGYTALILACSNGYIDIVKELVIRKDIEINLNINNHNALVYACLGGYFDIIKILINYGAIIDKKIIKLIDFSKIKNGSKCENIILINCLFLNLCADRDVKIEDIRYLIKSNDLNINVFNICNQTPLMIAVKNNCISTVKLLINSGAYIDESILNLIESKTSLECKKIISDNLEFLYVCKTGNIYRFNELINIEHVNIDVCDKNGFSGLTYACRNGHLEIVKMLISKEACIDVESLNFVENNNGKKCKKIINYNLKFFIACITNDINTVKKLINNKYVNINIRDKNGSTPFMLACKNRCLETTMELINICDTNAQDKRGKKAMDYTNTIYILELIKNKLSNNIKICDKKNKAYYYNSNGVLKSKEGIHFIVEMLQYPNEKFSIEINKNIKSKNDIIIYKYNNTVSNKRILITDYKKIDTILDSFLAKTNLIKYNSYHEELYKLINKIKLDKSTKSKYHDY